MFSDNFNLMEQVYTSVAFAFQMYNNNKKARPTEQNCYITAYNTNRAQRKKVLCDLQFFSYSRVGYCLFYKFK